MTRPSALSIKRVLSRRPAAIAAVLVILAAGAVAAVAASSSSSRNPQPSARAGAGVVSARQTAAFARQRTASRELAAAASYLHLTVKQLRTELRNGRSLADIAHATPGRNESGLIEAILAAKQNKLAQAAHALARRVTAQVRTPGGPAARARLYSVSRTVRAYLGLKSGQLRAALRAGKTLAQLANSTPGKSVNSLIQTLVVPRRQVLEAAVKAGRVSASSEGARLAQIERRFETLVNRVERPRGKHRSGLSTAF